jgi:hypothetical protein
MSGLGAAPDRDRAARDKVYAAERDLPPIDRLLAMTDEQAHALMSEHLGQPGYIVRLDGHAGQLLGFWHDSPSQGRVPVITAPAGYPLSHYEVAHEIAHLLTDQAGPRLGHGPTFVANYLHVLRHHTRLRDALRDGLQRQGLAPVASPPDLAGAPRPAGVRPVPQARCNRPAAPRRQAGRTAGAAWKTPPRSLR